MHCVSNTVMRALCGWYCSGDTVRLALLMGTPLLGHYVVGSVMGNCVARKVMEKTVRLIVQL